MTPTIAELLYLSLALYSITRLVVHDTLFRVPRNWVLWHLWVRNRQNWPNDRAKRTAFRTEDFGRYVPDCAPGVRGKLAEWLSCHKCAGFLLGVGSYLLFTEVDHVLVELWFAGHALRAAVLLMYAVGER